MDGSFDPLKLVCHTFGGHCAARGLCYGTRRPPSFRAALLTPSASAPSLGECTLSSLKLRNTHQNG